MKHLERERLLELGLDLRLTPTGDEAAHLNLCAACTHELRIERELTASIAALPQPAVPDLVAATTSRFEAALAQRRMRQSAVTLIVALALGFLAATGIVLGILVNAGPLINGLVTAFDEVIVVARASMVVLGALPAVPVTLTIVACVVTLMLTAGVGRLALSAAEAK